MPIRNVWVDNILREAWNEDANPRTVTFYSATGTFINTRNVTATEDSLITARIAAETAAANRRALAAAALADIDLLIQSVDALNVVIAKSNNQITGGDTKQVAQECRRAARAVIRILRMYLDALNSTNVGA